MEAGGNRDRTAANGIEEQRGVGDRGVGKQQNDIGDLSWEGTFGPLSGCIGGIVERQWNRPDLRCWPAWHR